jgi:CO/xanthine dehydrogenase FAD-binding subunit
MLTTDATIHLRGPAGERTTPFLGFHRLPRRSVARHEHRPGELITAVSFVPSGADPQLDLSQGARPRLV